MRKVRTKKKVGGGGVSESFEEVCVCICICGYPLWMMFYKFPIVKIKLPSSGTQYRSHFTKLIMGVKQAINDLKFCITTNDYDINSTHHLAYKLKMHGNDDNPDR